MKVPRAARALGRNGLRLRVLSTDSFLALGSGEGGRESPSEPSVSSSCEGDDFVSKPLAGRECTART